MLVIGDSLTQAEAASDGKTWYSVLGNRLQAQVFAYGVGGYGTLQELMVLADWLERVNPDAIIIQVSTNDVMNNSLELERRSLINNNLQVRPYYQTDGSIVYALPNQGGVMGLTETIPSWMFDVRIMRIFRGAVVKTYLRLFSGSSIEFKIAEDPEMPQYRDALAITDALFGRIKVKAGPRPLFGFVADNLAPFRKDLEASLQKNGFILISGIPEQLAEVSKDGQEILAADHAHWNEEGHKIVGETITRQMKNWFPASPDPSVVSNK
jgi:lysophospholipase L1-like esterase